MKLISIKKFSTTKEIILKCVDCKNFIPYIENNKSYDGLGKCMANGFYSLSEPIYFYASLCRKDELYCGEKAKLFKS
jgi:hypothetical protein